MIAASPEAADIFGVPSMHDDCAAVPAGVIYLPCVRYYHTCEVARSVLLSFACRLFLFTNLQQHPDLLKEGRISQELTDHIIGQVWP